LSFQVSNPKEVYSDDLEEENNTLLQGNIDEKMKKYQLQRTRKL
jgi:hypothetical protein